MSIFWAGGLEEKAKARKAAVLKLVWPWPPAAAFTYFPSLQLKLSQAFRPVCLIGRWTWKIIEKNYGSLENIAHSYQMICMFLNRFYLVNIREKGEPTNMIVLNWKIHKN